MTAIMAVWKSDSIDILSDGAWVRPNDGTLLAICSKQLLLRHPDTDAVIAVIASSGAASMILEFNTRANGMRSFDGLIAAAPTLWREVMASTPPPTLHIRGDDGSVPETPIVSAMALAGYSERDGRLMLYDLRSDIAPDGQPQAIVSAPGLVLTDSEIEHFANNPDTFNAYADGLDFMHKARQRVYEFNSGQLCRMVGGYVQRTRLDRFGVWSEIIHRWPDQIGQPIAANRGRRFCLPNARYQLNEVGG